MLTQKEKKWTRNAYDKGMTRLQIRRKLNEVEYSEKKISEIIEYYGELEEEDPKNLREEIDEEDEKDFKKSIKQYFDDPDELNYREKKAVKKFLKQIEKYSKMLRISLNKIKEEYAMLTKKVEVGSKKINKELEDLKEEMVDRIMDSMEIFDIEDPNTKESATRESLTECTLEQLIILMEENDELLELTVNGKIK